MKGLTSIPTQDDLVHAYNALQDTPHGNAAPVASSLLATLTQWSRFDPRLGELLVAHIARHWKVLPPAIFREEILKQPWPAAAGVLLEHVPRAGKMSRADIGVFRHWSAAVMSAIAPASGAELFFIGLNAFAGKRARSEALAPLNFYTRWGYLGTDLLVNKADQLSATLTLLGPSQRKNVLNELIRRRRPRITVGDYIDALEGKVSRRQAELDLRMDHRLVAVGRTRARFYRVRGRGLP